MKLSIMFFFNFLIFLSGVLSSCTQYQPYRYEYLNKKEIAQMKKLYLLGVNIDNTSTNKKNDVVFYSSAFVKDSFLDSFIKTFNENTNGIELSLIDREKYDVLLDNYFINKLKLDSYQNMPLPQIMKGEWIKKSYSNLDADGYIYIVFKTSIWQQNAIGFFKVYNTNGQVVWREQIYDYSPYIIYDKKSPYLAKNKQIETKPEDNSYYEELKKIYHVLGELLAYEFRESL